MANNYTVSDVSIDDSEAFLRVATLASGGSAYNGLSVSLDRRFTGKSEAPGVSAMNEVYLPLDTTTIEAVDGDTDRQEAYLRAHSRLVDGNRVNVVLVNYLLGPGEKPVAKNLAYLNDLLLWSRNHVYVPPTLTFDKSDKRPPEDRVETYNSFVSGMIDLKNRTVPGTLRAGIMIPRFYPRRSLQDLAALYGDEDKAPAFVAIDFANSKLATPSIEQKVTFAHRQFRDEKEERYFVYGMRVRPRRKGPTPGCAEDMTALMSGLNAVGRPHRDTPMNMVLPPFSWDSMITFHPNHYDYDRLLREKSMRDAFEKYLADQYAEVPDFSKPARPEDKHYGGHATNFARRTVNIEGAAIAQEVRDADTKAIKHRLEGKDATERARLLRDGL
jgi:hypothetical protein